MPIRTLTALLALTLASCCNSSQTNRYTAPLSEAPANGPGGRIKRSDVFRSIGLAEPGPMARHLNGTPREIIRLDNCVTMELWHNYSRSGIPAPSSMDPADADVALSGATDRHYYYEQVESIRLYKPDGTPIWRRDTQAYKKRK